MRRKVNISALMVFRNQRRRRKYDWEKKTTCSVYLSSKIFATLAWVWTRSTSFSSFQRSSWSPTYILPLFHLEDTAHLFLLLSCKRYDFFDRKDPKLSLSELLSWWQEFKCIHTTFLFYASWACALLKNNKQHVGRESFHTW
jgi:hypothetical protein